MTPERWQQINQLFHSALAYEGGQRAAFLARVCAGDEALQAEVESLVASHEQADSFIETPAADVAAELFAGAQTRLKAGQQLGHYTIMAALGAGGMGEVYLAEDKQLGRTVALKVLPADVAHDQERMRRFLQEARAAAALNHPRVAHIYEIGEADGTHFIAMEHVEGQTLEARISGRPLEADTIIEIGIEVADALAAAHTKGITHRDIKPANIMLTPRSEVKVLDFGLAKITAANTEGIASDIPTAIKTTPGLVLGTVAYMSPEQALGREVDQRTDIFSLGVVLYEMATGKRPFIGQTPTETIDQIAHAQPEAVSRFNYAIPTELERIIRKCLEKDRERRYQTAHELVIDLRNLLRDTIAQSVAPDKKETAPGRIDAKSRVSAHRTLAIALALAMLAAISVGIYWLRGHSSEARIDSIAVMPFVNASADPETEYLSDGITESLINSLSQLPHLNMIARSSVFRYKGKEVNLQTVGRELGVQAILTGRVVQHGDNLLISAELVDVQSNAHLWGEQYNRKLADLLTIQSEISLEISQKLRLRLAGADQKRVTKHYTENTEAYQLYLKGRFYWNRRTAEGLKKAIEQFQQAIDNDPNYALAYAGLADCYLLMQVYADTPPSVVLPKAKAAALRALQIDDSLVEAHASLAQFYTFSWQWGDAEAEFRRAIQLNPNYPTVHQWYSAELTYMGRLDEAMAEIKRAQELDPLSTVIALNVATAYTLRGDLDAAIALCKNFIELDPNFPGAHVSLALAYQRQGRFEEAIAATQKGVELSKRSAGPLGVLGYCYAVAGKRSEALATLRELEKKHARREAFGANLAYVYVGLGDKDQAFAWLEIDFQDRSGNLAFQLTNPILSTLRSDARYTDLRHRMGLRP